MAAGHSETSSSQAAKILCLTSSLGCNLELHGLNTQYAISESMSMSSGGGVAEFPRTTRLPYSLFKISRLTGGGGAGMDKSASITALFLSGREVWHRETTEKTRFNAVHRMMVSAALNCKADTLLLARRKHRPLNFAKSLTQRTGRDHSQTGVHLPVALKYPVPDHCANSDCSRKSRISASQ